MERFDMSQPGYTGTVSDTAERVTGFLRVVYGWMAVGLTLTAIVAWMVASSETLVYTIATNRLLFWGLFIAQLGVVFFLSARVQRLAPGIAATLFLAYSALTGLTFSIILVAYTRESIATTFFVTAGTFGALALYGTTTSRSLSGLGQFLFIVFTLLTAYDAQRLKAMALAVPPAQAGSYAIVGALTLYLDFINLFLFLLRFLGGRRD